MPLQNRVTPFGKIVAIPERGTMFGNRGGRFHDPHTQSLTNRRFATRRWICCELGFKGRRRTVFGSGYTELFFLDEATALAAGHRPCFECRYADAIRFREAFGRGNRWRHSPRAEEMDFVLHQERRASRSPWKNWRHLPDGAMIAEGDKACLVFSGQLFAWTAAGYRANPAAKGGRFHLLTPPSIVAALSAGYRARFHASVLALATADRRTGVELPIC
ncbi:MAG: hypothetical protein JO216_13035 [Hyphomicrobiales bacterium]|nr:hypothetical protein [Hyphomicrobiales bacterium]